MTRLWKDSKSDPISKRRSERILLMFVGPESALNDRALDGFLRCDCTLLVARSSSLLEAMSILASRAIDMVILAGEYRDAELSVFTVDARHSGFEGLILRIAETPGHLVGMEEQDQPPIRVGDFLIDSFSRRVWIRGSEVLLRPMEFECLRILCRYPDTRLSHSTLLKSIWGSPDTPSDRLRSLIRSVRGKIETSPDPRYLLTERHGYRFIPSPSDAS